MRLAPESETEVRVELVDVSDHVDEVIRDTVKQCLQSVLERPDQEIVKSLILSNCKQTTKRHQEVRVLEEEEFGDEVLFGFDHGQDLTQRYMVRLAHWHLPILHFARFAIHKMK